MSPSQVNSTLDDARSSFKSKNYSESRFSIHEALIEIEQQLGEKVLARMPKEALGQSYDPAEDRAISTGVGFIGLEIIRSYTSNKGDIKDNQNGRPWLLPHISSNSRHTGRTTMLYSNVPYANCPKIV